jgi:hypothetical protein
VALARARIEEFHRDGFITGIPVFSPLEPVARPDFPDRREVPV